jgi:alkylhydroperoxidase family enzyme
VLRDHRSSPLGDREKALFDFIEKVNAESNKITREDVERVKTAGWTEEAIYDAVTVCALFNFYNVWVDATGVHDMPADAYAMSGHRLATLGYAPPE